MENQFQLKNKLDTFYKVKGGNISFDVKDVDESKRTVEVVLNTMNFLDSDNDILMPGCAKRSIKERGPESSAVAKIKYCKDHRLTESIGRWTELSEKQITYKGQSLTVLSGLVYLPTTTAGQDQLINYRDGVIDNHSIGFKYENIIAIEKEAHGNSTQWDKYCDMLVNPDAVGDKKVMFAVKEINLFEGSSVAFGANSLTPYLGVKSGDKTGLKLRVFDRLELLEKMLREGKQSDEQMKDFELQMLQLKQIIEELSADFGVSDKQQAIDRSKPKPIDFDAVSKNLSLKL